LVELQALKRHQPAQAIKQAYVQLTPEQKAQIKALTEPQTVLEQKESVKAQPLQVGDRCKYIGNHKNFCCQYGDQTLIVDKIDGVWNTASCRKPNGSFTTWLPLKELGRTTD
jgi:hypothetical protein